MVRSAFGRVGVVGRREAWRETVFGGGRKWMLLARCPFDARERRSQELRSRDSGCSRKNELGDAFADQVVLFLPLMDANGR